ncbi:MULTISPECIES: FAD-linked oxidase C-terminal domain-containing protein [Thermodesulfobacterium]|jgi:glycolate oxidase|uniref:FAD-binding protein n=2 Tax=Thermodesulfobacterium commune TaxID=1741 RepID=A0A075WUD0_9BACT|nr:MULTISPECIES: FAD-linked oxidase C-terminal domain-containing protein [Thermodesulfobacterium]HAA84554.1 FAD-binding oxidoreductase [Thermodesulfobacterium commune]AIH04506.1 FAD-binding protein [Thermodesulfobacterium commune DSM 2178]MBZ4682422.1 FAD-binding protein [Thermodesulfobacterium sp.]MDK2861513.1 glycolate oxidase [Thermodesulfobacterium sp.]MDN5380308.1 glycolate oxidase [Thermodesulfobacterium sp.]
MLSNAFINACISLLGEENVLTKESELITYSYDATPGIPREIPGAVLFPQTTEQVQGIVKLCRENKVPIYPRGAGTCLSGGPVPLSKGVVISFQRMNKILEIDTDNLTATVQPGVVVATLNAEVAKYGLIYPPDPGSMAVATIGGTVAENAGGLRGLKYGVTKHYVMGMEVVLPTGEVFRFGGKTVKNVTAYDFTGLFVGSEGTLGIITEVILKLIPAPKYRKSMIAFFGTLEDAGQTVTDIIRAHVIPATLEIMDNMTIRTVENFAKVGLPTDAAALLLIEVDGNGKDGVEEEATKVIEVIQKNKGTYKVAETDQERDNLWAARRAALPALAQIKPATVLEDATVPRTKIVDMLRAIQEIAKKYNLTIGTFGHAGDGNLHPTILVDPMDKDEMARLDKAIDEIFEAALKLGGTLSGEHGIGIAKKKYLKNEIGSSGIEVMKRLKKALDPDNILNPGKLVPMED